MDVDHRDAEERRAVESALEGLPADHPARATFAEGAETIALAYLVTDRPELVETLKEAFLAGYRRMLERTAGAHFRP